MPEASSLKAWTYFLVRYVPDTAREEFLNLGLFLHNAEEQFLDCLFADDFRRLKRFHPQADCCFLRELQSYFEQQIQEHESNLEGYLQEMQESFSNLIQLTPPRPLLTAERRRNCNGSSKPMWANVWQLFRRRTLACVSSSGS